RKCLSILTQIGTLLFLNGSQLRDAVIAHRFFSGRSLRRWRDRRMFCIGGAHENSKAAHRLFERKQSSLRDSASSRSHYRAKDRPSRACESPAPCEGRYDKIRRSALNGGPPRRPPDRP